MWLSVPKCVADDVFMPAAQLAVWGAEENGAQSQLRRHFCIVDPEAREEYLMLVRGKSTREFLFGLLRAHATINQAPEAGIVKIVDVQIHLSPAQVVA